MSRFHFRRLFVEDHFDKDDELEIEMEGEETNFVWLPREEVIRLRDHLNKVLGD